MFSRFSGGPRRPCLEYSYFHSAALTLSLDLANIFLSNLYPNIISNECKNVFFELVFISGVRTSKGSPSSSVCVCVFFYSKILTKKGLRILRSVPKKCTYVWIQPLKKGAFFVGHPEEIDQDTCLDIRSEDLFHESCGQKWTLRK